MHRQQERKGRTVQSPSKYKEDLFAMEAILKAVPSELVTPLGLADDATAKKAFLTQELIEEMC